MECQACGGVICDGETIVQIVATTVIDAENENFLWAESTENRILHMACYHQLIHGETPELVAVPEQKETVCECSTDEQAKDASHNWNGFVERNNILSFLD